MAKQATRRTLGATSRLALTINQRDPTRTTGIRLALDRELNKRYRELAALIWQVVVVEDQFGLAGAPRDATKGLPKTNEAGIHSVHLATNRDSKSDKTRKGRYSTRGAVPSDLRRSPRKVQAFMRWLRSQEDIGLLETIQGTPIRGIGRKRIWASTYIMSAYRRGLVDGSRSVKKKGGSKRAKSLGKNYFDVAKAFNRPIHAEQLGLIFTRVFSELEGITREMDRQISAVLTRGLAEGRNPKDLARDMIAKVHNFAGTKGRSALTRAKLMARSTVGAAQRLSIIGVFSDAEGRLGEKILVEWYTALDDRVRPLHRERHELIFTQDGAQALAQDPNCRCTLLAYFPEDAKGKAKDVQRAADYAE